MGIAALNNNNLKESGIPGFRPYRTNFAAKKSAIDRNSGGLMGLFQSEVKFGLSSSLALAGNSAGVSQSSGSSAGSGTSLTATGLTSLSSYDNSFGSSTTHSTASSGSSGGHNTTMSAFQSSTASNSSIVSSCVGSLFSSNSPSNTASIMSGGPDTMTENNSVVAPDPSTWPQLSTSRAGAPLPLKKASTLGALKPLRP